MQTFDDSRLRITVNGDAHIIVPPSRRVDAPAVTKIEFKVEALDAAALDRLYGGLNRHRGLVVLVTVHTRAAMQTTVEFKVEALDAAALDRLYGAQARLPVPLVVYGRRLPKRRRDSRGRLRPMVRDRRLLVMTGMTTSGGVDRPMRVVAECVKRRRHPEWPGHGPGIVARVAAKMSQFGFDELLARSQFSTATGSDLDDVGEMVGLPRRDLVRHDPTVAAMFPNLPEDS